MQIYHYHADGLALGAEVVVVAATKREATMLARKWCGANSADKDSLRLVYIEDFEPPCVVHGWNGDY